MTNYKQTTKTSSDLIVTHLEEATCCLGQPKREYTCESFKIVAKQNQRWEQNATFLMHNFIKAVIQPEGSLWLPLIVCDIQENSSFQMPWKASPSAQAFLL